MKLKDLKKGQVVYAKWNGEETTIDDIKDGKIFYKTKDYGDKKVFIDTIDVFLQCFKLTKKE